MNDNLGRLGRYELRSVLGAGGFAEVFRAFDPRLQREVALKALLPHLAGEAETRRRFEEEGRALARLRHPNIVTVFDVGEADGRPYFTMELVQGWTLAEILAGGALLLDRAQEIAARLGSALDYIHAAGLVHRDVKPANVMLDQESRVVLMDLGVARSLDATRQTQTGASVGTPAYMAPEQVRGQPAGPAADIYALGVLVYQMLAGAPPFEGDTAFVLHAQAFEPPPPLADRRADLPTHVYAAVAAALTKQPEQRPASAGAFAAMLSGSHTPPAPIAPTAFAPPAAYTPPTVVAPYTPAGNGVAPYQPSGILAASYPPAGNAGQPPYAPAGNANGERRGAPPAGMLAAIGGGGLALVIVLIVLLVAAGRRTPPHNTSTVDPVAANVSLATATTHTPTVAATVPSSATPALAPSAMPTVPAPTRVSIAPPALVATRSAPPPTPAGMRPGPVPGGDYRLVSNTGQQKCINARANPGTSQPIYVCVIEGFVVHIIAGPVSANGYQWYNAEDLGWMAEGDPSSNTVWLAAMPAPPSAPAPVVAINSACVSLQTTLGPAGAPRVIYGDVQPVTAGPEVGTTNGWLFGWQYGQTLYMKYSAPLATGRTATGTIVATVRGQGSASPNGSYGTASLDGNFVDTVFGTNATGAIGTVSGWLSNSCPGE